MKDVLLKNGKEKITCKIKGAEMTYTNSRDPRFHVVVKLRDPGFYRQTGGYRFEYLDKERFDAKFYK